MDATDRVGGQLHGDKEYPFSGVTKSGRVWRKVLESDAWSVPPPPQLFILVEPDAWNSRETRACSLQRTGRLTDTEKGRQLPVGRNR